MKRLFFPLLGFLSLMLMCCNDNKESSGSYDPNQPVTISYFSPDTGRVAEKVIIQGNNFGTDKSAVSVLFTDNTGRENKAAIIGVNNQTIYCIAPRQAEGYNTISVKVNDKTVAAEGTFKYAVSENVSTITGDFKKDGAGKDGTLAEATLGHLFGVACLDEQSCILGQAWDGSGVRYVSVDEDAVITIQNGAVVGKVSATKDGSRAYGANINSTNTVYVYNKSQAWVPSRLADISAGTDVWAVALNGTEDWLYYVAANGTLGRIEVDNPTNNEILWNKNNDFSGGPFAYIAYSAYEDCFYVTTDKNKILKVTWDTTGAHHYEQINQNNTGTSDGYLDEATFQYLRGLTIDEEGNIYVCQANHVIRQINIVTRYVTTILGTADVAGNDDGSPEVALFSVPQDICYDGNGGFWIVQGGRRDNKNEDPALRKYSIE